MMTSRPLHPVATLSLAAIGCGAPNPADTADTSSAALEQPNRGLTTTDEMPDFADPEFAAVPEMSAGHRRPARRGRVVHR